MFEVTLFLISFVVLTAGTVAILLIGASAIVIFLVGVPFVPTPKKNVTLIINQLNLKPGEVFYDLGCGDGRFLIEAEKRGAKALGFEISPWAYLRAQINIFLHHSQAKVLYKNFYHANLKDADGVFCFLMDAVMPKVEKKLLAELKPGGRIVCYGFKLPTLTPNTIINLQPNNRNSSSIYLYVKK
ncbi:MAG: class I SAM-dependent methyltransferase [Candidatus Buchananbacteria bacterium]|nr:class I SAM-dependent methyltransferase [Candidatus Buchananbacteria bacterium]